MAMMLVVHVAMCMNYGPMFMNVSVGILGLVLMCVSVMLIVTMLVSVFYLIMSMSVFMFILRHC